MIPQLDWSRYEAVLFDVDGTLYDQPQLRRIMARELVLWCLAHPFRVREAKILATFRRLREENYERDETSLAEAQYRWTADKLKIDPTEVRRIADDWLLQRPLRHLAKCRPPGLKELFARLKSSGVKTGVFSDYPAAEKLTTLELAPDAVASALDASINRLKPHPAGLRSLCDRLQVEPGQAIHIGDRHDRDEPCAQRCGCVSIILPAHHAKNLGSAVTYDAIFPK